MGTSIYLNNSLLDDNLAHANINSCSTIANMEVPLAFQTDPTSFNGTLAISVKNVCKSYHKEVLTLNNLCMNVEKGTIYGLLGSSGCGKTTLLSCLVGLKKWDSGTICIFNKECKGTPGKIVGYMPQEIALHDSISIKETVEYYGRLYGMTKQEIENKWLWLVDFLHLPSQFVLIKDLSGGQKRRVSLAVSLVHTPHLLILDEPTVGLDPLLRESIWNHFESIVREQKITVLVTTHYIEETRGSDRVGVLRNGRILVEQSPRKLLEQYGCCLLEEVVLKLCHEDEKNLDTCFQQQDAVPQMKGITIVPNQILSQHLIGSSDTEVFNEKKNESTVLGRVSALAIVIWLMFLRHGGFMGMLLILPTLVTVLTLAVLGSEPKDLKLGVINQELPLDLCPFENLDNPTSRKGNSTVKKLSCGFVNEISKSMIIKLVSEESIEDAREQVKKGELIGFINFPDNFSDHLTSLLVEKMLSEASTIDGSRVHLTLDMSNYIATAFLFQDMLETYKRFTDLVAKSFLVNPKEYQIPMLYRKPVFGDDEGTSFYDYFIPSVLITLVYVFNALITALFFINDYKQGTLNRACTAGANIVEVIISHVITGTTVVISQTMIYSVVLYVFYGMRVSGSYLEFFLLCVLGGLSGQATGLLLGVGLQEEVEALCFGFFMLPTLLAYEGALWPVQGMTPIVRAISFMTPTTLLLEAVRSVMNRGVGLFSEFVLPGVLMSISWIGFLWVVSTLVFIRKQSNA